MAVSQASLPFEPSRKKPARAMRHQTAAIAASPHGTKASDEMTGLAAASERQGVALRAPLATGAPLGEQHLADRMAPGNQHWLPPH
jgi:hypothetical protein